MRDFGPAAPQKRKPVQRLALLQYNRTS